MSYGYTETEELLRSESGVPLRPGSSGSAMAASMTSSCCSEDGFRDGLPWNSPSICSSVNPCGTTWVPDRQGGWCQLPLMRGRLCV